MKRLLLFFLAFSFGHPLTVSAFEPGHLGINGFISQGYLVSSGNNFLADTTSGTFEVNEMGVTFHSRLNDKLRLGLQLLSRDLGKDGNNDVRLDWAIGDYRYRDWFGVRMGKIKLPIGLYNEVRDSDFLRPMAFLPQGIYDENKRNFMVSAAGVGVYGHLPLARLGDVDYQAFAGEGDCGEDSGQVLRFKNMVKQTAQQEGLGVLTKFEPDNQYVYGGSIIYNPPLNGLRLGASFFKGLSDFEIELTNSLSAEPFKTDGSGGLDDFWVFSLEYVSSEMTISSEYTEFTSVRELFGTPMSPEKSQGWYGLVSIRPLEKLTFSALYDHFYADKNDHGGKSYEQMGLPSYVAWRKDFGIGLRYDINFNWLVKAEWHHVDGAALGLDVFNPGGLERDWNYFVAKASFNF